MGTKFKIDQDPTFDKTVGIDRAGGSKIDVGFVFKYRIQSEVAAMTDEWGERRRKAAEEHEGKEGTVSSFVSVRIGLEIEELKDIIVAWDFDDPVNDGSIRRLVESVQTARDAIVNAYFAGLNPARLGN
ncbi:Phage tail assembly chaperone [compost metagenome]